MFCNKIDEMKIEVKDLKTKVNKVKNEKDCCVDCNCKTENRHMNQTIDKIEVNLTKLVKKDDIKSIDSDIQSLQKEQTENRLKIRSFDEQIGILVSEQKILLETANKNKDCIMKISAKVENKLIMVEQTNEMKCKICGQEFERICDLDEHLGMSHEKSKQYKCDLCSFECSLKRRFKEHMHSNHKQMQRTCHYYNNEKVCPYQSIGCKFAHSEAAFCLYGETCNRNKCPFRHRI